MQFSEPLGLPYWVSDNEKLARKQNENHANRNNKSRDKNLPFRYKTPGKEVRNQNQANAEGCSHSRGFVRIVRGTMYE